MLPRRVMLCLAFLLSDIAVPAATAPATSPATVSTNVQNYNAVVFNKGERVPFLGIFTHTEAGFTLDNQVASVKLLLANNPDISGVSIKLQWNNFHPQKEVVYWEKLEDLIDAISSQGRIVNLGIIAGLHTPEWVYEEGAIRVGPIEFNRENASTPVPWDEVFMKIWTRELGEIAKRYADDPRVSGINILGHNFKGEEMHAPPAETFKDHGISSEVVLNNWKYWIDTYARLFPKKKLNLTISQMYKDMPELPEQVVQYFVERYQGRAVLQTDQLTGREESKTESGEICRKYSALAPHCHELCGVFFERSARQGSPEMTAYNAIQYGNPLYLQLWRRDCVDPKSAAVLRQCVERFGGMKPDEIRKTLIEENLYVEISDWDPSTLTHESFSSPEQYEDYFRRVNAKKLN